MDRGCQEPRTGRTQFPMGQPFCAAETWEAQLLSVHAPRAKAPLTQSPTLSQPAYVKLN